MDQERALLSELYRRSRAPAATHADRAAPGASLLLVNDMEVRLQDDQVTAVPLTSTRRRQLLRQARSAERRFECKVGELGARLECRVRDRGKGLGVSGQWALGRASSPGSLNLGKGLLV